MDIFMILESLGILFLLIDNEWVTKVPKCKFEAPSELIFKEKYV